MEFDIFMAQDFFILIKLLSTCGWEFGKSGVTSVTFGKLFFIAENKF